ncbi:hypothetical protein D9M68_827540 [compost metagenome]
MQENDAVDRQRLEDCQHALKVDAFAAFIQVGIAVHLEPSALEYREVIVPSRVTHPDPRLRVVALEEVGAYA